MKRNKAKISSSTSYNIQRRKQTVAIKKLESSSDDSINSETDFGKKCSNKIDEKHDCSDENEESGNGRSSDCSSVKDSQDIDKEATAFQKSQTKQLSPVKFPSSSMTETSSTDRSLHDKISESEAETEKEVQSATDSVEDAIKLFKEWKTPEELIQIVQGLNYFFSQHNFQIVYKNFH